MASDELQGIFDEAFQMPTFVDCWPDLLQKYQEFGFTDPLTDGQRFEEFKWITEQLRKYVFSHQAQIEKCENADAALQVVRSLLSKTSDKATDRKTLVYTALRDSWLVNLANALMMMTTDEEL